MPPRRTRSAVKSTEKEKPGANTSVTVEIDDDQGAGIYTLPTRLIVRRPVFRFDTQAIQGLKEFFIIIATLTFSSGR